MVTPHTHTRTLIRIYARITEETLLIPLLCRIHSDSDHTFNRVRVLVVAPITATLAAQCMAQLHMVRFVRTVVVVVPLEHWQLIL